MVGEFPTVVKQRPPIAEVILCGTSLHPVAEKESSQEMPVAVNRHAILMAWTPLLCAASYVPEWQCRATTQLSRSVHDEHYDYRCRFGKECLSSSWG